MKVLIKKGSYTRGLNPTWSKAMRAVAGTWVKIETEHLFEDQFNTGPIPHAMNGVRLMMSDVEKIEDDFRVGRSRCNWCGKHCSSEYMFCPHCAHANLKPLLREKQWA